MSFEKTRTMKYNELHKKLRKAGCYPTGESIVGHPEWYSPITGKTFPTSNHGSKEIAPQTLKKSSATQEFNLGRTKQQMI